MANAPRPLLATAASHLGKPEIAATDMVRTAARVPDLGLGPLGSHPEDWLRARNGRSSLNSGRRIATVTGESGSTNNVTGARSLCALCGRRAILQLGGKVRLTRLPTLKMEVRIQAASRRARPAKGGEIEATTAVDHRGRRTVSGVRSARPHLCTKTWRDLESPTRSTAGQACRGSHRFALRPVMGVSNNFVLYDQHVKQNSMQSIVPELAKSWTWDEDSTRLTFKLHEGVRWHDGKPFTARDVKCTWKLLQGKTNEKFRIQRVTAPNSAIQSSTSWSTDDRWKPIRRSARRWFRKSSGSWQRTERGLSSSTCRRGIAGSPMSTA